MSAVGSLRGFKDVAEEGAVGGVQGPVLAQSLWTGRTMKKPLLVLKGPFAGWDDSASILSALRGGVGNAAAGELAELGRRRRIRGFSARGLGGPISAQELPPESVAFVGFNIPLKAPGKTCSGRLSLAHRWPSSPRVSPLPSVCVSASTLPLFIRTPVLWA